MTDAITLTAEEAAELRQGFVYCPRCGTPMVSKHVYGRMRRVCTECRFIQFIDPKVSAAVMAVQGGKVLLLQRAMDPGRGSWCFPGGFMEIDETPQETAIRECKEELGAEIEVGELMYIREYIGKNHEFSHKDNNHQVEYMFRCFLKTQPVESQANDIDAGQNGISWINIREGSLDRVYPKVLLKRLLTKYPEVYWGDIN